MIPINTAERKRSFLNFLLFFIITMAVILTTVFFSVQVPFRENDKLRKEKDLADNQRVALQSFELKMQETMNMLDSVSMSGNSLRYGNYVDNNVAEMYKMVSDSSDVKTLCNKIMDNLSSLRRAKEQIRTTNSNSAELEEKDRQIAKLQNDVATCNNQVVMLMSQSARK